MKIVVLDGYSLNPGDLSWKELEELGELTVYDRNVPEKTVERAYGAEAVMTNKTTLSGEIIRRLPDLRYIGVLATGYNVVDIKAARERGIVVTNIPAYSSESVAQMVFAHLLNIICRVQHYADENRDNSRWSASSDFVYRDYSIHEIAGMTMGIVGLGNIGQTVARIARRFGMGVLAYTSKTPGDLPEGVEKAELKRLFAESDVVSLHCPLTPATRHIVDAGMLSLMKPSAILINTGRGALIDEPALADALNSGRIYAAGLDVLSTEPPEDDNPLLSARNCFITPHIAWASVEARTRLMHIAAGNLKDFIAGHIRNCVSL